MCMRAPLEAYIHRIIQADGPIPFDRFMETALYHPEWGYYESDNTVIGCHGDFQTSVSVGAFFGELLARQFWAWCADDLNCQWLECGAHHGQLAEDILQSLEKLEQGKDRKVQYLILEPSPKRKAIQQERLKRFAPHVEWANDWEQVQTLFKQGVIFSNELLDAFPTKRFAWKKKTSCWQEYFVDSKQAEFQWKLLATDQGLPNTSIPIEEFQQLAKLLPDRYTIERSPSAESWWQQAADHLKQGHLVTIDYGFTGLDKFAPQRTNGTLRTYDQHRVGDDLISNPGQKDITAHVDFPVLKIIGEGSGLKTENLTSQETFMNHCLEKALHQGLQPSPKQLAQFRTLMHPEHFGKAFKVLVQST
jgi:SAM-dependent MidA family methyltransferase